MKDPLELAQLIVRYCYVNISNYQPFQNTSGIYKFTNENIASYFKHLENKKRVLTVIGSGAQVLNGILAGSDNFDCFDISVFPEYYLHLQIASILALSQEEYLKYYFSEDREELFSDYFYDKISLKLRGKYKQFWDTLYDFDDGVDIYNSPLFRQDICLKRTVLEYNPYLWDKNYEKLKNILETQNIKLNTVVADITKTRFNSKYDLINLSNILTYCFRGNLQEYINFFKNNLSLTNDGEIINYIFDIDPEILKMFNNMLKPNGYIEDNGNNKLLVYKK